MVLAADNGGLTHDRVFDKSVFEFDGAYPETVDLEHIVGAPGIPEVPILILVILIPGVEPVALESILALFMLVPIAGTDGVALDEQVADFADGNRTAMLVHQAGLAAGNNLAAGAGANCARAVSDEHVQGFGR